MPRRFLAHALALVGLALPAACGEPRQESGEPALVVLAAASLQEALEDTADVWEQRGHRRPVLSFAGSSSLARQIVQGAPADIFVSADQDWMDAAAEAGALKPGTRRDLLTNSIVLIAPRGAGTTVDLSSPAGLSAALGDGRLAMADPDAVPAGKYGKAALESLGLWRSLAGRTAPTENVRAALALVESGEAPLGIVYATDARASDKVRTVAAFPADSHPPIRYPMAVLAASANPAAEAFAGFLASPAGAEIFAAHGFGTAP